MRRIRRSLPRHITIPNWAAYQVRIVRDGREYSASFPWSRYADQSAALDAAVSWRDAMLVRLGPPRDGTGLRKSPLAHKTSYGRVGITRYLRTDSRKASRPQYLTFGVNYTDRRGSRRTKSFQVGNVEIVGGKEERHAARTAEAFRAEYEWSRRCGRVFRPERYARWREEVLYPFQSPVEEEGR